MQKVIISDTSCLILLHKLAALHILHKLFGVITITKEIQEEFQIELPEWIVVDNPTNINYQRILQASLDRGEASALALALEQKDCLVIIDELKGRRYAEQLGLKITGTLGVLIEAKLAGHIPLLKPLIEKIKATNFHLTSDLELKALEKAGEL